MLNYHLLQKLKLIENNCFKDLINILILSLMCELKFYLAQVLGQHGRGRTSSPSFALLA